MSKADLLAQANALLDRSAIVTAAAAGIQKIAPGTQVDKALIDSLWPDQTSVYSIVPLLKNVQWKQRTWATQYETKFKEENTAGYNTLCR